MSPQLYIDLLKKCLTETLKPEKEEYFVVKRFPMFSKKLKKGNYAIIKYNMDLEGEMIRKMNGQAIIRDAESMIGVKRMDNILFCLENVIKDNIPGDLIETGAWMGGATIFMRGILKAYDITDRKVYVADSFEGLPVPDKKYPSDKDSIYHTVKDLVAPFDQVKKNFKRYDLLDDQVVFLKGWFKDTLPAANLQKLAVVRLDGDMYESTMDGLTNLYHKLSIGGYLIVDDWGAVPACQQAIKDFRKQHNITEEIIPIDWTGVYWRKTKELE
ncbi:MAG: TylF/MycF/NovP-related O-methyltransferase [Bacteroidota bacterium]